MAIQAEPLSAATASQTQTLDRIHLDLLLATPAYVAATYAAPV
jgi:hypothetical protein